MDRAAALSGRGPARPAIAERRRAHDGDARPGVERTAADQRRHRRRPRREQGRRHLPDHDERYAVTREFLNVYSDLLAGKTVNVEGKHIRIEDGRLLFPPVQSPRPPLYFGGSSDAGIDVAVDTVDKYLTWGEPPAQVAEKIERVKAVAAARGRKLSFGIRLHVIVRETNEEAWKAADELIQHVTDETVASAQKIFSRMDSVGQQRMAQLHGGRRDKLEISPNLWAGVGLVRGGAGTALVGDPETVAARIREYQEVGIDTFIMSGYPHLEEAYRFAELVFPLLSLKQPNNVTPIRVNTGPFGETIANEHRPPRQGIAIMSSDRKSSARPAPALAAGRRPDPMDRAARDHPALAGRLRHRLRVGAGAAGAERRGAGGMEAAAVGRTGRAISGSVSGAPASAF